MSTEPDYAGLKIDPVIRTRLRTWKASRDLTYAEAIEELLDAYQAEDAPEASA